MTGLLKDLMHDRADNLGAPALEVDAMVRDGNRRVSRRRTMMTGGVAAAAVAAALVLPAVLPERVPQGSDVAAGPGASASYATGSVVHLGSQSIDVGREIHAFVATTDGIVFTDVDGAVWASNGDEPRQIGTTLAKYERLVADGEWAAWLDIARPGGPAFAVHSIDRDETRYLDTTTAPDVDNGPLVRAIDGDILWFDDGGVTKAWHFGTTDAPTAPETGDAEVEVADVEDGLIAYWSRSATNGGEDKSEEFRIGRSLTEGVTLPGYPGNNTDLSPDGRWALVEDSDRGVLYDVATGTEQPWDHAGYAYLVGYEWTGPDTFSALGLKNVDETTPADLLTCTASAGTCVVSTAEAGTTGSLQLPIGEDFTDH